MYCKLKRWYEKNGGKSTKKSKTENGKNKPKSTTIRIVKQIDADDVLADLKEKEIFDYCGKM